MRHLPSLICIGAFLAHGSASEAGAATQSSTASPAAAPDPAGLLRARIAVRFDPLRQCPELRLADLDDDNVTIVVFAVGPTGVPSQPLVRSAARTDGLDTASTDCVLRLRFQPAIRLGDGTPIESWQQIAWKWAPAHARSGSGSVPAPSAANETSVAAAPGAADAAVRVCVDATGKLQRDPTLVHSSGDASFDAAAVQIAKSGSGNYRAAGGAGASGCLELSIKPAGK
ncbi:MAG TPA: hypothetical protein VEY89_08760 [Candidatus Dormibacteraeota bacterium]|nr:hypothetical protein [Candidatus Dormibacteraeota bacterium]